MRILALAIPLALSLSTPAFALSCIDWEVTGALPADGATDQPVNARVAVRVFSWGEQAPPTLVDSEGNAVAATFETYRQGSETVFVLTPGAPLEADRTYSALVDGPWEAESRVATTFTTGALSDYGSPNSVVITDISSDSSVDVWGTWSDFVVSHTEAVDESGVMYRVLISQTEDMADPIERWTFVAGQTFSDNPCSTDPVGELRARNTWVSVEAVDVAGNGSEDLQLVCGTGCSTIGSAPGWGLVFLPLLMLGGRRRR